jgi:hypothetical protein
MTPSYVWFSHDYKQFLSRELQTNSILFLNIGFSTRRYDTAFYKHSCVGPMYRFSFEWRGIVNFRMFIILWQIWTLINCVSFRTANDRTMLVFALLEEWRVVWLLLFIHPNQDEFLRARKRIGLCVVSSATSNV